MDKYQEEALRLDGQLRAARAEVVRLEEQRAIMASANDSLRAARDELILEKERCTCGAWCQDIGGGRCRYENTCREILDLNQRTPNLSLPHVLGKIMQACSVPDAAAVTPETSP